MSLMAGTTPVVEPHNASRSGVWGVAWPSGHCRRWAGQVLRRAIGGVRDV